jgi:hypothetical protein
MHGRQAATTSLLVTLLLLSSSAIANSVTVKDNWNTRANLFDIEEVTAGHKGDVLRHTITTYHPWRTSELQSRRKRPRAICIYVWRKGRASGKQDYEICARYRKGKLRAAVWKVRPKRKHAGRAGVTRFDQNSISFTFDSSQIESPLLYRWQAVTGFTGKGCPRDPPYQFGCDDSAPTRSAIVHDLRPKAPEQGPTGP